MILTHCRCNFHYHCASGGVETWFLQTSPGIQRLAPSPSICSSAPSRPTDPSSQSAASCSSESYTDWLHCSLRYVKFKYTFAHCPSAISFNLPFRGRGHSILYVLIKGSRHFVSEPTRCPLPPVVHPKLCVAHAQRSDRESCGGCQGWGSGSESGLVWSGGRMDDWMDGWTGVPRRSIGVWPGLFSSGPTYTLLN